MPMKIAANNYKLQQTYCICTFTYKQDMPHVSPCIIFPNFFIIYSAASPGAGSSTTGSSATASTAGASICTYIFIHTS